MPASQKLIDHFIAEHSPAAAHHKNGGHIFQIKLVTNLIPARMLPEVGVYRNAGNSYFVYGNSAQHQFGL